MNKPRIPNLAVKPHETVQPVDPGKLPVMGRVEHPQVRMIRDELNYDIEGCPLKWLNVSNTGEAIAYYKETFPFLTDEVAESVAVMDLTHKLNVAMKQLKIHKQK